MKLKILSILTALFFTQYTRASIIITVNQPTYLTDSTIAVSAGVTSTFDLSSITAAIGAVQTNLSAAGGSFSGTLYKPGGFTLNDSLTLVVIATDVLDNKDTAVLKFLFKRPATPYNIIVDSPLSSTVARPMIHIKATFSNGLSNHSQYQISGEIWPSDNQIVFTIDTGSFSGADTVIDKIVDLSAYQGRNINIKFVGKNSIPDTTVTRTKTIFVDASPALEEVYTSPEGNYLVDFNFNRLVYVKQDTTIQTVDLDDHSVKNGPAGYRYYSPNDLFLTPYFPILIGTALATKRGAIFKATMPDDPSHLNPGLYDLNGDTTYTIVERTPELTGGGLYAAVSGNYAGYTFYGPPSGFPLGFRLRNLITLHDSLINSFERIGGGMPFEDGSAVYSDDINIYKYSASGTTTQLTHNTTGSYFGPFSDGKLIAYSGGDGIHIMDGIVDTLLSTGYSTDYNVKNGYVVYPKKGTFFNQKTLWIKDSTGASHQASIFSTDNSLDALGDSGKLVYHIDFFNPTDFDPSPRFPDYSVRQYVDNNLVTRAISSGLGKAYYYNGNFYVGIGRSLFRVNTGIGGDTVTTVSKTFKVDSLYTFAATDFSSAFKGPGDLITVKITALPSHGRLILSNNAVPVNTEIGRTMVSSLTYTPAPGFNGSDTMRWNGSSGAAYAARDTLLVLTAGTVLPITLLNFTATALDKLNQLNWQTAQENNSAYFDVERSTDGQHFTSLGTVGAKGNSSIVQTYSYSDVQPLQGITYYRLKMVDKDGNFKYSTIKSLSRNDVTFAASLYPNPTHNTASLLITSDRQQQVTIQLVDMAGNILITTPFVANTGTTIKEIDIKGLTNGIYTIRISGTNGNTVLKLLKQ